MPLKEGEERSNSLRSDLLYQTENDKIMKMGDENGDIFPSPRINLTFDS